MESVTKYCTLRRCLRILKELARAKIYGKEFFDNNEKEFRDFGLLVKELQVTPEITSIEEVRNLEGAIDHYLAGRGFWSNKNYISAYNMIVDNLNTVIQKAEGVCERIKPPRDEQNKDAVIQVIRRFRENEKKSNGQLVLGVHENVSNDLRGWVPGLECEDVFVDLKNSLETWDKVKIQAGTYALIGLVKAEYRITEDEIEELEEVRRLKNEAVVLQSSLTAYETRENLLRGLITALREDAIARKAEEPASKKPKPPIPKEKVREIRTMLGSFTSSDELTLEMRELAADLIGTWGDTDMGTKIMESYLEIKEHVPPDKSVKGSPYEIKVISLLNEVEKRQERYGEV